MKITNMRYDDTSAGPGPEVMGADTLIGNDVCNREEENLGEVKEIMLDVATGRVAYAVLSYGGVLGMGDKLFAVPWNALELDTENKRFLLDIDKESLKSAPGFDKDSWPRFADPMWGEDIHRFYRAEPYWESRGPGSESREPGSDPRA